MAKKKVLSAATEEQVGFLHNIATQLFTIKAKSILAQAEELELIDAEYVINLADVDKIARFCDMNGITAAGAAEDETSELSLALKKIKDKNKNKIITFTGTDE